MNLAEYSVKNRVVIIFAVVFIVLGGISSYFEMGKLEDAEFTLKTALVITPYPGASPHEVELEVTDVIEKAVQATNGIDYVESESRTALSVVKLEMESGLKNAQMPQTWDILRKKINDIRGDLPNGTYGPIVLDDFGDVYGVFLALTGEDLEYDELLKYAEYLKREFLLTEDVAKIEIIGERTQCVEVSISPSRMARLGIHPEQIIGTLNGQGTLVDAGEIDLFSRKIRIREDGAFKSIEEIGELVIQGSNQLKLKDIAKISREFKKPDESFMRYNGKESLGIAISTVSGGNVVNMGEDLDDKLMKLNANLPVGVNVDKIYFQSDEVIKANNIFIVNLLESLGIVVLVLLLSMGLRSGLLIGSGLILTILATFIVMNGSDISLQRTSLAAIIVAMGMLVDNAIVVTDAALVAIKRGIPKQKAVIGAATSTAGPLLGATMIAIIAFLPIFLSPGNAGEICKSLFLVLAISLGLSWLLAMTQISLSCDIFLKENQDKENTDPFASRSYRIFKRILEKCLKYRYMSLIVLLVLLISSLFVFTKVKKAFFLALDKPLITLNYWLPEGSSIYQVSDDLKEVEAELLSWPEVETVTTQVGESLPRYALMVEVVNPNASFGQVLVKLQSFDQLPETRKKIEKYLNDCYPEAKPRTKILIGGPPITYKVEARFSGPDPKILRELAEQAEEIMNVDPWAKNIGNDWRQKVMVLNTSYSQSKARRCGVSREDVANAFSGVNYGSIIGMFKEDNKQLPIVLKTNENDAGDQGFFENIGVYGDGQQATILSQVIDDFKVEWEDPVVHRYNRRRAITAYCDPISGNITGDQLRSRILDQIESIPLPEGYELMWDGEYKPQKDANDEIKAFFPFAVILMVFIIVILFNSVRQTLIVFLLLPLSLIGVANGLFVLDKAFGFMAIVGFLGLMGMIIKNAVVLIDQINILLKDGKAPYHAVVEAAVSRMRPVMMASMTTILGMLPLVTDAMYGSMAATVMFGLLFATVLTLIVVPLLFVFLYRIKVE